MEDFILREMEECGADGVDFVPVWFDTSFPPVYKSYTKQEWIESDGSYPKTNRMYWRIVNGQKVYIDPNMTIYKKEEAHKFDIEEMLKGIKR
jgi:hypothetical protein